MSKPSRLRDDASASPETRALLGRAHRTPALPETVRARSMARLDRALILPAAAGVLFWLKGVAVAAGALVLGVVVVTKVIPALGARERTPLSVGAPSVTGASPLAAPAIPRPPSASPFLPQSPRPTVSTLAASPVVSGVVASSAPSFPASPLPSALPPQQDVSSSSSSPIVADVPVDSLAREAAMLERARASLEHDPAASLAELNAHAAAFPTGTLAMERELLAVNALGRLGRVREARARGEALLGDAQGSIYEARVRAMLDALPAQ